MRKLIYLLPLLLIMAACQAVPPSAQTVIEAVNATLTAVAQNNPQENTSQSASTPNTIQAAPTGESPAISLEALFNGTYRSPDWGEFQLTDGMYYRTPPTSLDSADTYTTRLLDTIIYGDLNADGLEDAVVFLSTQSGGTGHFVEVAAVLNVDGVPYNISTLYLGDRVVIESGVIENGIITIHLIEQGPNDAMCCPSQNVERSYRLENDQLVEVP
ncbi:MAG TPA: hypothetical protein VN376_06855 [Longilinea sp.]|nr:hypothetical protein [Longilinea sp.]